MFYHSCKKCIVCEKQFLKLNQLIQIDRYLYNINYRVIKLLTDNRYILYNFIEELEMH